MNSARLNPDQDPDELLYELDSCRERLNTCDPPERLMDRQFEDVVLQTLPPEYERIRTSHLEKTNFGIADIRSMMNAMYTIDPASSSSTTGIAGRGAVMPAAEDNRRESAARATSPTERRI